MTYDEIRALATAPGAKPVDVWVDHCVRFRRPPHELIGFGHPGAKKRMDKDLADEVERFIKSYISEVVG